MGGGFVAHIFAAYGGLRASMRRELDRSSGEEHLLALAAYGSFVVFLSFLPSLLATDLRGNPDQSLAAGITMWFFVVMFFLPLMLYGIAAASHYIARKFGAGGPYYKGRLALFWAMAVLSPAFIIKSVLASLVMQVAGAQEALWLGLLNLALLLVILRVWSAFLAEAEGFASWRVFLTIVAVLAAIYGILFLATL